MWKPESLIAEWTLDSIWFPASWTDQTSNVLNWRGSIGIRAGIQLIHSRQFPIAVWTLDKLSRVNGNHDTSLFIGFQWGRTVIMGMVVHLLWVWILGGDGDGSVVGCCWPIVVGVVVVVVPRKTIRRSLVGFLVHGSDTW